MKVVDPKCLKLLEFKHLFPLPSILYNLLVRAAVTTLKHRLVLQPLTFRLAAWDWTLPSPFHSLHRRWAPFTAHPPANDFKHGPSKTVKSCARRGSEPAERNKDSIRCWVTSRRDWLKQSAGNSNGRQMEKESSHVLSPHNMASETV